MSPSCRHVSFLGVYTAVRKIHSGMAECSGVKQEDGECINRMGDIKSSELQARLGHGTVPQYGTVASGSVLEAAWIPPQAYMRPLMAAVWTEPTGHGMGEPSVQVPLSGL